MGNLKMLSSNALEQKICAHWTLDDFEAIQDTRVYSDTFRADFCEQFGWRLLLERTNGKCMSSQGKFFGIYLCNPEENVNEVKVDIAFGIVGEDGQITSDHEPFVQDFREISLGEGDGYVRFLGRNTISDYLVKNALKLQVIIKFLDLEKITVPIQNYKKLEMYRDLIGNQWTDFEIVTSDGKSMGVHKTILQSVWPYFATMTAIGMEEAQSKRWQVEDHDYETMKLIVSYVYVGEIQLENSMMACKLLKAAHQYHLPQLMAISEQHLMKSIDVNIVLAVLVMAELFELQNLKQACYASIEKVKTDKESGIRAFSQFPGWEHFLLPKNMQLIAELLDKFFASA